MTVVLDPAHVATLVLGELRPRINALPLPLSLVGFLAADGSDAPHAPHAPHAAPERHRPSATYALYAQRACLELGIHFEIRRVARLQIEAAIREANQDPGVDGMMVYYPVFGTEQDVYLRDLVDPSKDIEGLHSSWARRLYENQRFLDAAKTKKAILPCTPLAILKLVDAAGYLAKQGRPLAGLRVCIFNRSEVVGRPLASMMAHDGAQVFSFDVDGPLCFRPGVTPEAAHEVVETKITRAEALRDADIVITGVPSKSFELVRAAELRPGGLCINFSTHKNFSDDVIGCAGTFVPRVGPMTVLMVIRNALRLRDNQTVRDNQSLRDTETRRG